MEQVGHIVQDIDFGEEEQCLSEVNAICKRDCVQISIDGARDIMMRGLRHFIGDSAQWLPEYEQVADWLEDNQGKGLLCYGHCGRGKTMLTAKVIPCIIHRWARKTVMCRTAYEAGLQFEQVMGMKLLCIDDVGTEGIVNVYGNKIYALPTIVNEAERKGNLLLLSTNMTFDEIRAKYGIRTADRITGLCKAVRFRGESLRGK